MRGRTRSIVGLAKEIVVVICLNGFVILVKKEDLICCESQWTYQILHFFCCQVKLKTELGIIRIKIVTVCSVCTIIPFFTDKSIILYLHFLACID